MLVVGYPAGEQAILGGGPISWLAWMRCADRDGADSRSICRAFFGESYRLGDREKFPSIRGRKSTDENEDDL